jgi:CRISPR-associated protein Csb2
MLAIEVTFLTGRYVATAYNTRSEAEWPPHPARTFSALVATHFAAAATGETHAEEREALEWLERQGPPQIHASEAARRDVVTVFVPVNDVGLTDVDADARRLTEARAQHLASEISGDSKAAKKAKAALTKAEAGLRKAIARETEVPRSTSNPGDGLRVLPAHRTRQPRTFPSATPAEPRVIFAWPDAVPVPAQRVALAAILSRVVRMGHSSSLVSMRLIEDPPPAVWTPAAEGELSLRVVDVGQLRALEAAFERHREEEPRVLPALAQPYTRQPAVGVLPMAAASTFGEQWLVLRRVEGPQLPIISTVGLAYAVRKALMAHATEPIAEILSGHAADGRPTTSPHIAVVPLAFVGHAHATGTILGVALILPREVSEPDKRAVYGAVSRWEAAFRLEDEDTPRIKVNLGSAGELWLERVEFGTVQASLRPAVWCGPASSWSSVSPLALDRNPGDLRARNATTLAEATAEAEASVRRSCVRIGLPEPRQVDVLPAAPWAAAAKARFYPPYPGIEGRVQRVLTHARIQFDRPVRGPVLLGAGRFVGLGLFRPEAG